MPLPLPDHAAIDHSNRVARYIKEQIHSAGGAISFAEYMQHALYAPELGYYNGVCQFGANGDFTTAPEISALFSQCIANQCAQVLNLIPNSYLLEIGAGSGKMALEILNSLEKKGSLPQGYLIFEPSPALRRRQQDYFTTHAPKFTNQVTWLEQLPTTPFNGVILANEVLDAMPIHRFRIEESKVLEYYVGIQGNDLIWEFNPSSAELAQYAQTLKNNHFADCQDYTSEINLALKPWLNTISSFLQTGLALILDYGYPQAEYYHPQREQGTLQCFFRHHVHDNPLIYPGIQDITAHVDFSALAEWANLAGFDFAGYTHQAAFLIGCGLETLVETTDHLQHFNLSSQIKKLTLPDEMGEVIKACALTKGIKPDLIGFSFIDRSMQL